MCTFHIDKILFNSLIVTRHQFTTKVISSYFTMCHKLGHMQTYKQGSLGPTDSENMLVDLLDSEPVRISNA